MGWVIIIIITFNKLINLQFVKIEQRMTVMQLNILSIYDHFQ